MTELYWITRMDIISNVLVAFAIAFAVTAFFCFLFWILAEKDDEDRKSLCKGLKYSTPLSILFIIGAIFTPTTKDMMVIYGVGGTIDYLKSNDKAKKLPDKAIEALNRYFDSIGKEEKYDHKND